MCLLFFQGKRKKAVGLGVSVALKHWDAEAQKVTDDCPDRDNIQFQITAKIKEYEKKIQRLEVMDIPVTFENLFEQNSKRLNCSVGEYLKQTIERLETLGKYGSASKHRSLLSRLSEFRSLNTRFDEIDLAFLRDFELFLRKEGNVNNSIATQYAILQCLCIRCHGGLCPLFRTHQNQRKSSLTIWSGCFCVDSDGCEKGDTGLHDNEYTNIAKWRIGWLYYCLHCPLYAGTVQNHAGTLNLFHRTECSAT